MTDNDLMLQIKEIDSGYGKKQVLFDISIIVKPGEIVALIGPNGAGKSTVLKVVHGLLDVWRGELIYQGSLLNKTMTTLRVSRGITFAPQGNRVFSELTVKENLEIGGCQLSKQEIKCRMEEILQFFPPLAERLKQITGRLSGGEQQMLSLARALMPKPKLLLLDEPSLGLSPNLVSTIFEKITEISHKTMTSIMVVEQKVREILDICDRVYSLKLGKIAFEGLPEELKRDKAKLKQLFL